MIQFATLMAGASGASSLFASSSANAAASQSQAEAARRYALQAGIAKEQMYEQNQMAMEQMTEVSKKFLMAKGRSTVVQAESGVSGKVAQRLKFMQRAKASETKGKIVKEAQTNINNIANDMLAKKIDTDADIARAEAQKKSSLTMLAEAGMAGMSGYASGSTMASEDWFKSSSLGQYFK